MNPHRKLIIVCVSLAILLTGCHTEAKSPSVILPSPSLQPSKAPPQQTSCVEWNNNEPLLVLGSGQVYPFANSISSPGIFISDNEPLCCVAKESSFHYIIPTYSEGQCSVTHHHIYEGGSQWESTVLPLEDSLLVDKGNSYILSFWSKTEGALLVTNSGGYSVFYKTSDSGITWSSAISIGWHAPHVVGGGFLSADFGIICYQYHGERPLDLLVTEDGGESWSLLALEIPGMLSSDYAEGGTPFWRDNEIVLPVTVYRNTEQGLSSAHVDFFSTDNGCTWILSDSSLSESSWELIQ